MRSIKMACCTFTGGYIPGLFPGWTHYSNFLEPWLVNCQPYSNNKTGGSQHIKPHKATAWFLGDLKLLVNGFCDFKARTIPLYGFFFF